MEDEIDFQSTLEPDVIINDGSDDAGETYDTIDKPQIKRVKDKNIVPEISIIPVRRKPPPFKIKLNGIFKQDIDDKVLQRASRQTVRLVTQEEAIQAEMSNTILKRKSLPLEKCPICKKYFRRMRTHLQKHEDIKRDPADPLTCQYCMKSFNTSSNLSIHMRTHTGDKPYQCEVCTKGFSQSCNLVNHMRIHTGERPFKCPHCDRAFTQSGNLSNHIRLHTDEKPFKCHFCDKAFTQSGNLNSHIRNNHKFTTGELHTSITSF